MLVMQGFKKAMSIKRGAFFFDYIGPFQASVQQTVRALSQAPPSRPPGPF